jgi:hypothetical protein
MTQDIANAAPAGAGAPEIQITPSMVEAGEDVLERHYLGEGVYDLTAATLTEVFRAMDGARQRSCR